MTFAKRARLPQAEDSAPMRVSRTNPLRQGLGLQPQRNPPHLKKVVSEQNAGHSAIETGYYRNTRFCIAKRGLPFGSPLR